MKTLPALILCFCVATLCGTERLAWSSELNFPDRWRPNSSGKMTVSANPAERSLLFQAEAGEKGTFWVYPTFTLRPGELLVDAREMSFEIRAKQQNPEAGYTLSIVQLQPGNKMIRFPAPPADGSWSKVTLDLAGAKIDLATIKAIQIGFNPTSPEIFYELKNIRLYGKSDSVRMVEAADAIDFHAPGAAYRVGEKVTFRLKPQYRDTPSTYRVEDWSGKIVAAGEFPEQGSGTLDLSALPRGYYRLVLDAFSGKRPFAILPDLRDRAKNPDMPYCVDSCLSWHGRRNSLGWQTRDKELNWRSPGPNFELGIELCDRLGVSLVRERIPADVAKPDGKYDFGQYLINAENYAKRNIQVLDMYIAPPKWFTAQPGKSFASDALEVYEFAKNFSAGLRDKVTHWEFGNEQDLSGPYCARTTGAGIWDYIAMLKAAAYGHKEGAPETSFINGGLAFLPIRPAIGVYFKNDYQLYGDAFNVHTYHHLDGYPEMITQIREFLKENDVSDMPIYFTEFGTHADGSGEVDSHLSGMKEHSEDQELIMAEFIPKANLLYQQFGVEKAFLFVLSAYNEGAGAKVWGQLRHDFTVKPGFVALAVQIEQLGNAALLGEMKMPEGVRAFLFRQPDGSQSVVLWSVSPVETQARRGIKPTPLLSKPIRLPASGAVTATEMLGTQSILQPEQGTVTVVATRFPQYLAGLSGLVAETPATPLRPFVRKDEEKYEKGIVMNMVFPGACKVSYMGDFISIPEDKTDAHFQIWNLTDREQKGTVIGKGCPLTGIPAEITLPPKSRQEFPVRVDCSGAIDGAIEFTGAFNGKKISRLTIPFRQTHRIAEAVRQEAIPWTTDPKLWRGPYVKHTEFDENENAVAIDIAFPSGTHPWCYPEYKLQLPQESLKGAYGIAFEMKSSAPINMCLLITPLDTPGRPGSYAELNMDPPEKERWKEYVLALDQAPGEITALRFGMTPGGGIAAYRLHIRNVRALYRE